MSTATVAGVAEDTTRRRSSSPTERPLLSLLRMSRPGATPERYLDRQLAAGGGLEAVAELVHTGLAPRS